MKNKLKTWLQLCRRFHRFPYMRIPLTLDGGSRLVDSKTCLSAWMSKMTNGNERYYCCITLAGKCRKLSLKQARIMPLLKRNFLTTFLQRKTLSMKYTNSIKQSRKTQKQLTRFTQDFRQLSINCDFVAVDKEIKS